MSRIQTQGVLLGVDYGNVRIGIAICDPDRILASPLETYRRQTERADAAYFCRIATVHRAVGWVVGLPLHAGGEESDKSLEVRAFGVWLERSTNLPVVFWDERFTTALAEEALLEAKLSHRKRRQRRDKVAAQLILRAFLEAGCPAEGTQSSAAN